MKFVFPNLGNLSVLLCALMREAGGSCVGPIPTTVRTAELGAKYAPSDACMPMKIVLGNFIEGYENGADTALFLGGFGPCCFGYFAETYKLIFEQNGIKLNVITLEPDLQGVSQGLKLFHDVSDSSLVYLAHLLRKGFSYVRVLDEFEHQMYKKRAEINDLDELKRLNNFVRDTKQRLNKADSLDVVHDIAAEAIKRLEDFKSDSIPNVKIGIVGDIYSVIDSYMNKDIQGLLADMGVYSQKNMSLSLWIEDKLKNKKQEWQKYADTFLKENVGGFARETVGSAAYWADGAFDGIIEIYPLNCMPENVAKTILPTISKKYNKPIMSLIVDEMSGEAGYITRLEAFTQMIIRRKEAEYERALPRN